MARNPIDCFKKHAPDMVDVFGQTSGSRQDAADLALKEFERLHGELEEFKAAILPKYKTKAFTSPDVKKIRDKYAQPVPEEVEEITPEEKQIIEEVKITEDEARKVKQTKPARSRKSRTVVENIEAEAEAIISSGDATRAGGAIETLESAEQSILEDQEIDDTFEQKYGVLEVEFAKKTEELPSSYSLSQVYMASTGKELENEEEFKADLITALSKEGIKAKNKISVEPNEQVQVAVTPKKATPLKSKGIASAQASATKDDLRPQHSGVYVDGDNYVATDAHQLVVIKKEESDQEVYDAIALAAGKEWDKQNKKGNVKESKKQFVDFRVSAAKKGGLSGKVIDMSRGRVVESVRFPDYKQIIPQITLQTKEIDIDELINLANGAAFAFSNTTDTGILVFDFSGTEKGLNPKLLLNNLQILKANGAKKVTIHIDPHQQRTVVIHTDNGNMGLVMPMVVESSQGRAPLVSTPVSYEVNPVGETKELIDALFEESPTKKGEEVTSKEQAEKVPEQASEGKTAQEPTEADVEEEEDLISEDIEVALSEFADKKVQISKTERVAHGKGFLNKPVKVKPTKEQRAKLSEAIRTAVEAPTKENKAKARDAFIEIYESPYTGSKQVKAIWKQLTDTFPEIKEAAVKAVRKPRTAMRAKGRKTKAFEKLKKSFPNVEVISDPTEVAAAKAAANTTADAFVWEGKIFVEPSAGDLELAEEFTHIWVGLAKHFNSAIYNKAVRDIQQLEEFNDMRSDPDYDNLTDIQVAEEVLAKKIANKGGGLKILPSNLTPSNATIDKIVKTAAREIYGGRAISFATSAEIDKAMDKGVAMEISTSSALNPKNTAARKVMRFIDEYFTSGKGLDKVGIRNELERINNKIRATVSEIRIRHDYLQKLIRKEPDKETVIKDVALVFNGSKALTDLPADIQPTMEKLMSLRSEFQDLLLDNLVREGKVIMNDDLKMVLTNNYDESLDFETAAQQLEEHYDAEFERAEALTDPDDIQAMYEEYIVNKAELLNKKRELIVQELEAKINLAKTKGADIPARMQKLYNQLRDIQVKIDKFQPKASVDPAVTAAQDAQRKVIDKEIKKLQKELDAVVPSALTPTEQILLEDIQNLEDTLSTLMETQGEVNQESLLKLIDKVAGIEASLNEKEMSMNETIGIRYKKVGDTYNLTMFQKNGTTHDVTGVSEKDIELLLGEDQMDTMKHDGEGYVNTNPKIFYNNTLYESIMRGTDYVNRSYMMHDHKDFRNNVAKYIGQDVFDEAVAFLNKKYSDKRIASVRWEDTPKGVREYTFTNIYGVESSPMEVDDPVAFFRKIGLNERQVNAVVNSSGNKYSFRGAKGKYVNTGVEFPLSAPQMDNLIREIVSVNETNKDIKSSGLKVDTGALKRRKNIEPEIRALMGEYLDPRVNIFRTLIKSALLAEQTRFNRWFLDQGEGIYVSDKETEQHTKKVTSQEIPTLGDQETIWVTKEIYDVMWGDEKALNKGVVRAFTQLSGWTKGMLTVFSPASQARNFWGAAINLLKSGNIAAIPYLAQATRIVSQDFTKAQSMGTLMSSPLFAMRALTNKSFGFKGNEALVEAYKEAVEAGLVSSSAEVGELQDSLNMIDEFAVTKGQKAKAVYKKTMQVFSKPYQMTDSIFKVAAYMYEKENYMNAGHTEEEAKKIAAENVKNMQPTYDRAPKVMRMLSRSPLVGNFVLFRAEVFRTTYNILKTSIKEMRSDNPEIRKMGIRRAASAALMTSVTPALSALFANLLGLTDEEEEAVRVLSPEYFENNQFLTLKLEDGNFAYIDLSFIDPSSDFHRAFEAALRGEDPIAKSKGALKELTGDFLDWDIFLKAAVIDLIKNEDVYKRKIYHEDDDPLPKAWDMIKHGADPLVPKGIRDIRDFIAKGSDNIYNLNFRDETMNQLVGMKKKERDLKVATYYRLNDLKEKYDSHRDYYREDKTDKGKKKSMRKMDETFREMKIIHDSGAKLFDIDKVARGRFDKYNRRALPDDLRAALKSGKITNYKLE